MNQPIDEDWLRRRHDALPGATSRAFDPLLDDQGCSSYERTARHVRPGDRVLDLACGDGRLLQCLQSRAPRSVAGIDFSTKELEAARARLPGCRLIRGRVQEIPFADDSLDVVLCHMALMLFDQLDDVLDEVRRVVTPGGRFVVVLSRWDDADPVRRTWREQLRGYEKTKVRLVDPRPRKGELPDMLRAAGFDHVDVQDFAVEARFPLAEAWEWMALTYDPGLLSEADQRDLEDGFRRWLSATYPDGMVRFALPMQSVIAS